MYHTNAGAARSNIASSLATPPAPIMEREERPLTSALKQQEALLADLKSAVLGLEERLAPARVARPAEPKSPGPGGDTSTIHGIVEQNNSHLMTAIGYLREMRDTLTF